MRSRPAAALLLVPLLAGGLPAAARAGSLFAERVAPLLRQRCLSCHDGHKKRGGLDLSTRRALLEGGDNGPVLVPGDPGQSPLLRAVSGARPEMPRQGPRLTGE